MKRKKDQHAEKIYQAREAATLQAYATRSNSVSEKDQDWIGTYLAEC
jgi:hypothetical protein